MITRVVDASGRVVHDCSESGCDVSWDGYSLRDSAPVEARADPDKEYWTVTGKTARLKRETNE